ncbi:BF3164 family lipoprotein [Algoriphagus machipongonensis]|uniref:Lipoprotein n=1 Tax=Algoriphagus machipongonensis TaxID=388413 RepID=A3HVK0_9BACT|nr:BF3164 family lipoprotein [Algoriphagus machipongonensis]EAZ82172.1 hypothetical protein ALPR1_02985 [Algoriphagus machipongonensis]
MRYLYHLALSIFFFSCTSESEKNSIISIELDDFKEIEISSELHFFEEIINPSSFMHQGDKILIGEYHNVPDEYPRFHIINTVDWTYDKPKGKVGQGPLENNVPSFIESQDKDNFWVNDYNNRKISSFSMNDTSLLASKDHNIPDPSLGRLDLILIPNGNYLGMASESESKILEFDREGKLIGHYGDLEKIAEMPDLPINQISLLNKGRFGGNQENEVYVLTSMYRDKLEIFNYKTKDFISVIGPDLKVPEFEYIDSKFGGMMSFPPNYPKKYQEVAVSEKFIFALYSGFSYNDYAKSGLTAKEIRVFTLKGKPKWRLLLDRSVSYISINEQANEIYALTTGEDPGIAVFQIPKELL